MPRPRRGARWRQWLGIAFVVLVLALVINLARRLDWAGAWDALQGLPLAVVGGAALLAAASHLLYCGYDLIGRRQTGHRLALRQVATVGFVSYAFNLNLGALVGGVAFRYKLYTRLGLEIGVVTQVLALSMLTNWLGYVLLAGGLLIWAPLPLPADWGIDSAALPGIGALLWLAVGLYLAACGLSRRREWRWRHHVLKLPTLKLALLQLLVSSLNWMLIAGVSWLLLQQRVDYVQVLGVLLLAAVAGVLTHVPAGLGVLEAVFLSLLGSQVPQGELLAALLAYRVLYYLLPLALAAGLLIAGLPRPAPGQSASVSGASGST